MNGGYWFFARAGLVLFLGLASSFRFTQPTDAKPWTAQAPTENARICEDDAFSSPVDSRLAATSFPGITLHSLAASSVSELPPEPLRLILKRIILQPTAGADRRMATGPLLYAVESGEVALYPAGVRHVLKPGDELLVDAGQRYAIKNESSSPATLLRLSLAPGTGEDVPIANYLTPEPMLTATPTQAPSQILLFSAGPLSPANGPWLLFISCLTWEDATAKTDVHLHPGPVGLRLLEGRLDVAFPGEVRSLPANGCSFFPANTPNQLAANGGNSVALLVGAIPASDLLWIKASLSQSDNPQAAFNTSTVSCGP